MRKVVFCCAMVFAESCAGPKTIAATCFNGWSTDRYGSSKIYNPSQSETDLIRTQIPKDQKIICIHRTGNSDLIVVTQKEDELFGFRIRKKIERFETIEEGMIVTLN